MMILLFCFILAGKIRLMPEEIEARQQLLFCGLFSEWKNKAKGTWDCAGSKQGGQMWLVK